MILIELKVGAILKFSELFDDSDFEYDSNGEIQAVTRDTRREALEDGLSRAASLNEYWDVFRDSVVETIVDEEFFRNCITNARQSVMQVVFETEKDKLINIAANKLIARSKCEVLEVAAKILLEDSESASEIKHLAVALLRDQLRADVESQVKEQLLKDEAFVESVKRELKRQIMGI